MAGEVDFKSILEDKTEELQQPFDQMLTDVEHAVNYDPNRIAVLDSIEIENDTEAASNEAQNEEEVTK